MLREGAEDTRREADVADHDRILGASRRLLALIGEILDLSKIEAGKMEVVSEIFDPRACGFETIETVAKIAEGNGTELHIEVDESVGLINSDPFRFGQCLLNLLSNAAKFTCRGDITLRMREESTDAVSSLVCEVIDTGIGIPAEKLQKLFEPFTQADESTTRAFGGTGLGLTITRRIAQLLGGDVTLVSAVDVGTTATLRIPTGALCSQRVAADCRLCL